MIILTDSYTTFSWHLLLLFKLLFFLYLCLPIFLRPQKLCSILIASSFCVHIQSQNYIIFRFIVYKKLIQLIMLNPIKNLVGKLNHFHIPQTRYMRIIQLANSIRNTNTNNKFQQATVQSILALKSNTSSLNARVFHKLEFDYQVHKQSAVYSNPSTILDDLGPHQRKISHLISSYSNRLNSRQLLYLNMALIKKFKNQFPDWNNLHLSQVSPSKVDLQVLPCLSSRSRLQQLKSQPKKVIMKNIIQAKSNKP